MLTKLMKVEFAALSRLLLPVYAAVLVLSGVGHFWVLANLRVEQNNFLKALFGLFIVVYVLSIMASILLTFFLVVQRFYKSMVCDEGYLTHTLPASISTVVGAKLLSGFVWMLAGLVSALLGLAILFLNRVTWAALVAEFSSLAEISELFKAQNGISISQLIAFAVVLLLVELLVQTIVFYASVALGQLFGKQKLLGSVLGYMGINVASQLLALVMMMATLLATGSTAALFDASVSAVDIAMPSLVVALLQQLIVGGGCWLITTWVMKNRLNLE